MADGKTQQQLTFNTPAASQLPFDQVLGAEAGKAYLEVPILFSVASPTGKSDQEDEKVPLSPRVKAEGKDESDNKEDDGDDID